MRTPTRELLHSATLSVINEKPADLLNEGLIEVGSEKGTQIRYYPCCTKHWNLAYDHK